LDDNANLACAFDRDIDKRKRVVHDQI
jgi:hypothetical protein